MWSARGRIMEGKSIIFLFDQEHYLKEIKILMIFLIKGV